MPTRNFATLLKTPVASDAVFYTFYHKLHRYDDGWWIVAKHINRIVIDYDMDIAEDVANYKAKMEATKGFLIKTDLDYSPEERYQAHGRIQGKEVHDVDPFLII